MQIEIDNRPAKGGWNAAESKPFTAIRIKPDTNAEMAKLEWIAQVGFIPTAFVRVCNDGMSYVVTFRTKDERDAGEIK